MVLATAPKTCVVTSSAPANRAVQLLWTDTATRFVLASAWQPRRNVVSSPSRSGETSMGGAQARARVDALRQPTHTGRGSPTTRHTPSSPAAWTTAGRCCGVGAPGGGRWCFTRARWWRRNEPGGRFAGSWARILKKNGHTPAWSGQFQLSIREFYCAAPAPAGSPAGLAMNALRMASTRARFTPRSP